MDKLAATPLLISYTIGGIDSRAAHAFCSNAAEPSRPTLSSGKFTSKKNKLLIIIGIEPVT